MERESGVDMPVWIEILVNVIGYAGFVAVATLQKPSHEAPHETIS